MIPYVPSEKTDGKSQDRKLIDAKVEKLAQKIAANTPTNFSVGEEYLKAFFEIGDTILASTKNQGVVSPASEAVELAQTIIVVGASYNYEGAFLGELNYAITRLIQRVPQVKVALGQYEAKSELRYWLYAVTVEALIRASGEFNTKGIIGIGGVFEDIKDEYKRRVNVAYEAAQIIKSGDCYSTPYYTRLVAVKDEAGDVIGYQEIMLQRSEASLKDDVLKGSFLFISDNILVK